MNPLYFIVFIFIGHSNMAGDCAGACDVPDNPHIWSYSQDKGIYHGTEKLPVKLFLNEISLRYPEYNFLGLNYQYPSSMVSEMRPGEYHYDKMMKDLAYLKTVATMGGVVSLYGFIEGSNQTLANTFVSDFMTLIYNIRKVVENDTLPVIIGRYEVNNQRLPEIAKYRTYENIVRNKLILLTKNDPFIQMSPIRDVPKEDYCVNHHWTCDGFKIWAHDAIAIYQANNFDFWKR